MPNQIGNNKRVLKNTVYLYVRMLITVFVSLYTSRVVLQYLGVVDFGILNVVGAFIYFYCPPDVVNLWGDPTKAKKKLGWNPQKTTFEQLVSIMVKYDMEKVAADHVASVTRTNLAEYLEKGLVK